MGTIILIPWSYNKKLEYINKYLSQCLRYDNYETNKRETFSVICYSGTTLAFAI